MPEAARTPLDPGERAEPAMFEIAIKAIQIALSVGIVALLWIGTSAALSSASRAPLPAVQSASSDRSDAGGRAADYDVIGRRDLFVAVEPPAPAPVEPPMEETGLSLRLLGTVVIGAPTDRRNAATIIDVDQETRTVQVDQVIAGGKAVVEAIENGRIVISQGDRREVVSLPEAPRPETPLMRQRTGPGGELVVGPRPTRPDEIAIGPSNAPRAPAPSPTAQRSLPQTRDAIRSAAAQRITDRRARTASIARASRAVRQMVQLDTETGADGQSAAVRITGVTRGTPAESLGFRQGDRVVSVNGIELVGRGIPPQLVQSFMRGGDPVVAVEDPDGRAREITVPREMLIGEDSGGALDRDRD